MSTSRFSKSSLRGWGSAQVVIHASLSCQSFTKTVPTTHHFHHSPGFVSPMLAFSSFRLSKPSPASLATRWLRQSAYCGSAGPKIGFFMQSTYGGLAGPKTVIQGFGPLFAVYKRQQKISFSKCHRKSITALCHGCSV